MPLKRRSHRTKKNVNYVIDEDKDEDSTHRSDDDFEEDFAPTSKKTKVKNIVKTKNKFSNNGVETSSPRPSCGEKLYQQDIKKALELSFNNNNPESPQSEAKQKPDVSNTVKNTSKEDSDYCPSQEATGSEDGGDSDGSHNTVAGDCDGLQSYRNVETTEQFLTKRKSKQNDNKEVAVSSPASRPKPKAKQKAESTVASMKPLKSPSRGSWSSFGLGGVVIKNPGPPIRVGLSRNTKVKPLHANVTVTN